MITPEIVQAVWNKGRIVEKNDPALWRMDTCGAWMGKAHYGNRDSQYGWEVDHINPNGGDGLANLQPLQWENNVAKGDGPMVCAVRANGVKNEKVAAAVAR